MMMVVMTINWRDVSCGGAEVGCAGQVFENSMQLDDRKRKSYPRGCSVFVTYLDFITPRE